MLTITDYKTSGPHSRSLGLAHLNRAPRLRGGFAPSSSSGQGAAFLAQSAAARGCRCVHGGGGRYAAANVQPKYTS